MNETRRQQLARTALDGLSVGDALGERFFIDPRLALQRIEARTLPTGIWRWTDDTALAIALVSELEASGRIDVHALGQRYARRYAQEPWRGYGAGMHGLFPAIAGGADPVEEAGRLFNGSGSFGNGAAMRVAPLGGWFADDVERAAEQAGEQARATHAHPEGMAGAMAVAVAAAMAWQTRRESSQVAADAIWDAVLEYTPDSQVRVGICAARELGSVSSPEAARDLGSGWQVTAQDTVPFVLWSATHALDDFEGCLWLTLAGLGDRDTTCAMVGGIVALRTSVLDAAEHVTGIPPEWLERREPLP